jgi:hypothetical protein
MKIFLNRMVAIALFAATSCGKKDAAISDATAIGNQLTASSWGVHYLYYNSDQTTAFASYAFTFRKDSSLTVASTSESFNGRWYTKKQNEGSVQLTINITSLTQIQLINNNWKIISNDGALIIMKDYDAASTREFHLFRL